MDLHPKITATLRLTFEELRELVQQRINDEQIDRPAQIEGWEIEYTGQYDDREPVAIKFNIKP